MFVGKLCVFTDQQGFQHIVRGITLVASENGGELCRRVQDVQTREIFVAISDNLRLLEQQSSS